MGRLLVLIVLIVLAVWLVRRALRLSGSRTQVKRHSGSQGDLVQCARCGVHLPRAEARQAGDALYCSEEHARLGKA